MNFERTSFKESKYLLCLMRAGILFIMFIIFVMFDDSRYYANVCFRCAALALTFESILSNPEQISIQQNKYS